MDQPHLDRLTPIPESDMPPSRPTIKIVLGAVIVVLAVAVLTHEHQLAAMLGI